jgi:hypothetical protein
VRRLFLAGLAAGLLAMTGAGRAGAASRVSVQPFDGEDGPALRQQIGRLLRQHGFRVLTSIARVDGTGQYLTLARDHRLAAFVTGDVEAHRRRQTITFLVWNGATGSVLGRWSASAAPRRLPKLVTRRFWKQLGHALDDAAAPPSGELPPAPPMYINAAEP